MVMVLKNVIVPAVGFTVCAQKQGICAHTFLHLLHLILAANHHISF